jgi:hypothetical protein
MLPGPSRRLVPRITGYRLCLLGSALVGVVVAAFVLPYFWPHLFHSAGVVLLVLIIEVLFFLASWLVGIVTAVCMFAALALQFVMASQ